MASIFAKVSTNLNNAFASPTDPSLNFYISCLAYILARAYVTTLDAVL
jgi:hypothetical protein